MSANLLPYSRKKWREAGYYVDSSESVFRVPGGLTRRKDLFGFSDLVAVPSKPPYRLIFIQTTSWDNVRARLNKITRENTGNGQHEKSMQELARFILLCGSSILIEGWKLNKSRRYVSRELWLFEQPDLTLGYTEVRP